jgi:hypothetical protein
MDFIRVTKSRIRWTRHVMCTVKMRNAYRILAGKSEGKRLAEDLGVDGKILERRVASCGLDS